MTRLWQDLRLMALGACLLLVCPLMALLELGRYCSETIEENSKK